MSNELKEQFYSESSKCPPSIKLLFNAFNFYEVNQLLFINHHTEEQNFSGNSEKEKSDLSRMVKSKPSQIFLFLCYKIKKKAKDAKPIDY